MKLRAFRGLVFINVFIMAVLLGTAMFASAQDVNQKWEPIRGSAVDIAVSEGGNVAALRSDGRVYRFDVANRSWQPIGKSMARITGGGNDTFYGVDKSGSVRQFTGTQWALIGRGGQEVVRGGEDSLYVVTNTGSLARYDLTSKDWEVIPGRGARLVFDANNILWRINENGTIARRLDDAWISVAGNAVDIAADSEGRVIIVGTNGQFYYWSEETAQWQPFGNVTQGRAVAIGDGQVWRVDKDGKIYAQGIARNSTIADGITTSPTGDGTVDPNEVADTSEIVFEEVPDNSKLADLAIGQNGSVFALTSEGEIRQWSNTDEEFFVFPGQVDRIAIKGDGLPFAIGPNENLLEHDGEAWRQVTLPLALIDLAIFGDDRLLVVNTDEQSARLSESLTSFTLLPQRGQQIAAQEDGSFWVIDSTNRLFKCDDNGLCNRQSSNAQDISIGPAGSVFIVDTNATLRRYNASSGEFDIIGQRQGQIARVAAGPRDRPWVIDINGQVLASEFFERDESGDRNLATKTTATEDVTQEEPDVATNTGIQLVKNISFVTATIPTSTSAFGNIGSGIFDISVGEDDIVIATGFADPCVDGTGRNWVYNSLSKTFGHLDYLKRINLLGAVAAKDLDIFINADQPPQTPTPGIPSFYGIWNRTCNTPELVTYIQEVFENNEDSQDFSGAVLNTPAGPGMESDIDYAGDGSVGNINRQRKLEVFMPGTSEEVDEFDSIQFLRIGLGKDGKDLWAVNTSNNVYQYSEAQDTFVLRSANQIDKAQDVGVGQDGTVFIVNMQGQLRKWDSVSRRFTATNKSGVTRVAVDSRGNPIVANFPTSQTVFFGR